MNGFQTLILALILTVLPGQFFAQEPDPKPEKKRSIFDILKPSSPGSEEGGESEGLLGGITSIVDDVGGALKDKMNDFESFIESSSEAKSKLNFLLEYVDTKVAGREPAFTEEQIQAHSKQITPLIESLNQRKFKSPPKVESVGNFQMIKILATELVPQFEKNLPDIPKPLIYLKAYYSAAMFTPGLLGKYGTADQTIYILPENIRAVVEADLLDAKYEEDVLKIVIGHELTHGLQDQEVGLASKLLSIKDPDALSAFNATIEGHAVFMENSLAEKMGLSEAATAANKLIMTKDLEDDAWAFERAAHVGAVQMEQVYLGGERFIAHHFKKGGVDRIWQLVATPPQRSSMITQPETYTSTPKPLPNYKEMFSGVLAVTGLENWVQNTSHLGDFNLRGRLASVKGEQRESILRGMSQAAAVMMMDETDLNNWVEVAAFEFYSSNQTDLMTQAINKLLHQNLTDAESNPSVKVTEKKSGNYNAGGGWRGEYFQYTIESRFSGQLKQTNLILKNGNKVINLIEQESGLKKPEIDALIQHLSTRF